MSKGGLGKVSCICPDRKRAIPVYQRSPLSRRGARGDFNGAHTLPSEHIYDNSDNKESLGGNIPEAIGVPKIYMRTTYLNFYENLYCGGLYKCEIVKRSTETGKLFIDRRRRIFREIGVVCVNQVGV